MPYLVTGAQPMRAGAAGGRPFRGSLLQIPGDLGPMPYLVVGAAQLNRAGGLGLVPLMPRVGVVGSRDGLSGYYRIDLARPRGLSGDFTDRPWRNLAEVSIGASIPPRLGRLGYYTARGR